MIFFSDYFSLDSIHVHMPKHCEGACGLWIGLDLIVKWVLMLLSIVAVVVVFGTMDFPWLKQLPCIILSLLATATATDTLTLSRSSFVVVCVNRVVRLRRMQPLRGILMLLWCVWRRAEQESWGRVQYIVKRLYSFCSSFRFGIGVCKLENVDM